MKSIVGKVLRDRYRLIQELGHDDFSSVYVASDIVQGSTQCQIEQLEPLYDSEVLGAQSWQTVQQIFLEQGKMLQEISQHPQIPQLLDFFESDRQFYLVYELIEGKSLERQLEHSIINESEAIQWLRQILQILEFVHQTNIAHLNIQPASLVQHPDQRKFLTDFAGIKNAVLFEQRSPKTIANPNFSNPESNSEPSADIYALGKTIIYALTGSLADLIQAQSGQSAHSESELDLSTVKNPPDDLDDAKLSSFAQANIHPELATVLNKMVNSNPAQRYQSATEVLAELKFEPQNMVAFPPPLLTTREPSRGNNRRTGSGYPRRKRHRSSTAVRRSRWFNFRWSNFNLFKAAVWFVVALPFITALVIVFIGLNKNAYREFANYASGDYRFNIRYPQSWSRRDLDDPITGEIVVFASPLETDNDLFLEKVSIAIESLPLAASTLEDYSEIVFERINQKEGNTIEVYQDRRTKIDDSPARTVVYSRKEAGLELRQMEVFTIKNDQVYVAIYTAERAKFSKFLPTAEKIIDSWEIQ